MTSLAAGLIAAAIILTIGADGDAERPLYEHFDFQGNHVVIGQGACLHGPMSLVFRGEAHELRAGEDWPAGCFHNRRSK